MYFHTDDPITIKLLKGVVDAAARDDRRLRFNVDSEGRLHWKLGEGTWELFSSTPDPYRDNS